MGEIPKSHPRYASLKTREKISKAMREGIVHETGLIAHGRGEAFDYLIGETTTPQADQAEKVAAASQLLAKNPVISLNGNVVALSAEECISLSNAVPAKLEVNLFHRTNERIKKIINELEKHGEKKIYGTKSDACIPGLDHDRGICDKDGIYSADVILVPLEDGDRCKALRDMGKEVIVIDLNPISRSSKTASIAIVDNLTRAIPNIEKWVNKLKNEDRSILKKLVSNWDNSKMLKEVLSYISKRLNSLF
jgi:4-phosphopantoate--beta-alanine ligase